MRKKVLSLCLALGLCLSLLPGAALAAGYTEVVPCKYDGVSGFHEGMAMVMNEDRKYGFLDKTGQEVIPCTYDWVSDFHEGIARVDLDGKHGLIDKAGQEVMPCKYDYMEDFYEGLAAVKLDGKWGLIDKTGQEVIPCQYDGVGHFFDGLARVEKDHKYGFIDKTGQEIVPIGRYDSVNYFHEGLSVVELDGKWGFIDTTGREVVPIGTYDYIDNFHEGMAMVLLGDWETGKWGFLDTEGREVVPCQYDGVGSFDRGFAKVCVGSKWGVIDKTGQVVLSCQYDGVEDFFKYLPEPDHNYGLLDKTYLVPPGQYDSVYLFSEGMAVVEKDGKYGFIALTASPSSQTVTVDGEPVEFAMYALDGGSTNYIRVRDLAAILNGTAAQFQVGWDGNVTLTSHTPYDGSTDKAPFHTDMTYTDYTEPTYVDGEAVSLEAIQIEYNGGGFTYYKLRDLGKALGFNVGWADETGIYVETDKPYDPNN